MTDRTITLRVATDLPDEELKTLHYAETKDGPGILESEEFHNRGIDNESEEFNEIVTVSLADYPGALRALVKAGERLQEVLDDVLEGDHGAERELFRDALATASKVSDS